MITLRSPLHGLGIASVLLCILGCEARAVSLPQEQAVAVSPGTQPAAPETVTLEFEPPPEFHERSSSGAFVITGFRVGYFRAVPDGGRKNAQQRPLQTSWIARDALKIVGSMVQLSFKPEPVRAGNAQVVFRVQAVREGAEGFWSEPTAVVTLPERVPAVSKRPTFEATLATHPALVEALRALDAKGDWYKSFRRVQDLALAVVVCRDHGVPCAELAARMTGRPPQPMRRALLQWKDESSIPELIRSATVESRRLLSKTAKKK
jgi:hypothetical protein